jgi:membrane-associated phospholipid phosphatase
MLKNNFYITDVNKNKVLLWTIVYSMTIYFIPAYFPIKTPLYLELTDLEKKIPLNTLWIFPYIYLYPFCILIAVKIKNLKNINILFLAFYLIQMIAFLIFLFYPIAYPREFYPLELIDRIDINLLRLVRIIDKSHNCLPSMHVANVVLMFLGMVLENKKSFWWAFPITLLICLSTLFVKQHYVLDVIWGIILAISGFCLSYLFIKFKLLVEK